MRSRNKDVLFSSGLDDNINYVNSTPAEKSLLAEYPTYMIIEPLFQLWFLSDVIFYKPAYEDIIKRAKKYYRNKSLKKEYYP
jgi:hypothetical protein